MRRVLLTLVGVLVAALVNQAAAQGVNNVRINEVLVDNENNLVDDYGHRSSWIEIFNSGYEAVNVASCYIAVTRADGSETRYQIPKDPATAMPSQGYLVFFCEGTDTKGTFYTNFKLMDGENVTATKITLLNSNGKDIIDEFPIDRAAQRVDVSIGRMGSDRDVVALNTTTPRATNETIAGESKGELFLKQDRSGIVMAIVAMSVVFAALALIFFVLKVFGALMIRLQERKTAKPAEVAPAPVKRKPAVEQVQEELAAVALAIKLFQEEQHIRESTVITINRVNRVYSPWSSKIHGITPIPVKN